MLDRNLVKNQPELIRENLTKRFSSTEYHTKLDELISLIDERREIITKTSEKRALRKAISKSIGKLMGQKKFEAAEAKKDEVRALGDELKTLSELEKLMETRERSALLSLPNLLDERVPTGKTEEANVEVRRFGEPRVLDFAPKDHVELGEELGIIDFATAAKISGARFSLLKGDGARLIRALYNFFLDEAENNGYIEHVVPYIVGSDAMLGTGQLPKFEEDLFKLSAPLNGSDAYLIPTAEVPLTNIHAGDLLESKDLPIKYVAMTPCFRSEAGSYGRDTRGLMRQHQFHKVEMVQFCTAGQAAAAHEELVGHAEGLLQKLGLPYKVMMLSSGDTSFSAHICYDLEVWIPAQNTYREISSCSWFADFQGRRMGARYRDPDIKKPQALHTINGSGLAVGRTAIAVIENYQQADGQIAIPVVLQKYMGGREFIRPTT